MREIYFVTGNKNKFAEALAVIPSLCQLDIDLPEIQEIDPKLVISSKLQEALGHKKSGLIVEDTALYLDCLNGFPGPLIKWLRKTIGNEGIFNLAYKMGNVGAEAKTMIGYAENEKEIRYFEGTLRGEIVFPRGDTNFGWDPIFQPAGHEKTFAEMAPELKNSLSMRRKAFEELKKHLAF